MRRKGAQDAKKGKILTKVQREITAACKSGMPDPASNPRLRTAILWAREENMPRDRIEAAIKRASSSASTDNFEPVRYEGYGPGGTAVIVQALTDNRNRTASEVRSAFTKGGGNMGETGSVSFMFNFVGLITYPLAVATEDAMMEAAIEAGAENCEISGDLHIITCTQETLPSVREQLEKKFGAPISAKMTWQPQNTVAVNEEQAKAILRMIEMLEDSDDVQEVFSNFEIPEALMTSLSA